MHAKKISLVLFLSAASAQAAVTCTGWVGPQDANTGTPFVLRTDLDNSAETEISGTADGVYALMIYDKSRNQVEISVSDTQTKFTAGSHGSFNGSGIYNIGYSFASADGKSDRHVLLECKK